MDGKWRRLVSAGAMAAGAKLNWIMLGWERASAWLSGAAIDDSSKAVTKMQTLLDRPVIQYTLLAGAVTILTWPLLVRWYLRAVRHFLPTPAKPPDTINALRAIASAPAPTIHIGPIPNPTTRPLLAALVGNAAIAHSGLRLGWSDPPALMVCPRCKGTAMDWGKYQRPCPLCKATGKLPSMLVEYDQCLYCRGSGCDGGVYEQPCRVCGGYGYRIPPEIAALRLQEYFKSKGIS
jgi:hypothetical protein